MNKTELSKLIMDYGDFRVNTHTFDELRDYETELVNRLYEAINKGGICECGNEKPHPEQSHCEECINEAFTYQYNKLNSP